MSMGRRLKFAGTVCLLMAISMVAPADKASEGRGLPEYLVGRNVPAELQGLEREGRFTEAEAWIDTALESASDGRALRDEKERLRRLRRDYSVTPGELREKLSSSIPDVSLEDISKWREAGEIQWALIDGETRYFRREPVNLFRFSEEARARRAAAEKKETEEAAGDPSAGKPVQEFTLEQYMEKALDAAEKSGNDIVLPNRFRIRHTITVDADAVPAGETVRCWLPYPRDYRQQKGGYDLETTPAENYVSANDAPQRTIYLEKVAKAGEPTVFDAEFTYENASFVPNIDPDKATLTEGVPGAEFLESQEPHLLLTDEMRELAQEIVGDEPNPYRKAEKIFRWMDSEIRYASEMEYCILASVSEKIMTERHGDCGVQAIMFIGLCRSVGVPARWQSGWVTRPGYWNMHDWAEFYVEPYGWLPADPSLGFRKSDNVAVREFLFGHIDAYRMIANLDFSKPFDPPKEHFRSDPVDSQRGEVEWKGGNVYYDQFKYKVEILESEPVEKAKQV